MTIGVRRRSVGAQRALGRAGTRMSADEIDAVVVFLIDRITSRMRAAGHTGRTVVLRLRFDDFSRAARSHTLPFDGAPPDVLDQAVDQIHRRFGKSALTRAALLGRDQGLEMPHLPD